MAIKLTFLLVIFEACFVINRALTEQEIVDAVNNNASSTWRAKLYPVKFPVSSSSLSESSSETAASETESENHFRRHLFFYRWSNLPLPTSFDARKRWAYCDTIFDIHDQGQCGSCWAVSVSSAISDRICIKHPKDKPVRVSATTLLNCLNEGNCDDGYEPRFAWEYFVEHGLPTGGFFNTSDTCQPYEYPGSFNPDGTKIADFLIEGDPDTCSLQCIEPYGGAFWTDLRFGTSAYEVRPDEYSIMRELFDHGPVAAVINVYEDFLLYESGVYQHVAGNLTGYHAFKVVGWGEEDGLKYWICANSWSRFWGEDGFVRVKRGFNEIGIEAGVTAGMPR